MVTGVDIINSDVVVEMALRDAKLIRSCFIENPKKNTGSLKNVDKVAQEREIECGHEFLRNN